jgi:haloalkane dehalogenase
MRVSFTPSPDLYPFESKWFESSVGPVHYVDEGEGPPILFCHGNPAWSFLYRRLILELRKDFRCIAMDYPGFGLSDHPAGYGYTPAEHARVVSALVARLDLKNVVVMGQDWGGPIGVAAALSDPARIRGFVFGNTWAWPASLKNTLFSLFMSTPLMQRKILQENFFVEKLIPFGVTRALSEPEMDHYRLVLPTPEMRSGAAIFPRQIRGARKWLAELDRGIRSELRQKPLLLTWGMKDAAFEPSFIPGWRRRFPDNQLLELPNAKHFIQEDESAAIAQAIRGRFG